MTTTTETKGAQPTHRIYSVNGEGKAAKWIEIGALWPHKDGQGFSGTCDAVPLNGRLVMRLVTERPAETAEQPA